jgi:Rps23 Pro-64 3,4-dihydroxylase Tpa1-like proline 4-hydroxylase
LSISFHKYLSSSSIASVCGSIVFLAVCSLFEFSDVRCVTF